MRSLIAVAACLLVCLTCGGEEKEKTIWPRSAGMDVCSAAYEGALKFMVSQQFSHHWTIDANYTARLRELRRGFDSEEIEHYSELGYPLNEEDYSEYEMMTGDITVSYWVSEGYRGLFIQTGCRTGVEMRVEGIAGLGYAIKIWKGLRCSLSYDTTIGSKRRSHLGVTISYVMK